ncbi:hypothetical protein [Halorubrum sp. PV6]|uniref:hypothetical protein n=1 Tax=Halorubrum sp. PV6 TaxID=634157 RepID=UPI000F8EC3EF|nr:hypothetical protein [Halorubrum sp. PV6]
MSEHEEMEEVYSRLSDGENRARELERTQVDLQHRVEMLEKVIVHLIDKSDIDPDEIGDTETLGQSPVTSIR